MTSPFLRSKDSTKKTMMYLSISLIPIILFSLYKNSFVLYFYKDGSFIDAIHPILMYIVAILTCFISEALFLKFILKKEVKEIKDSYFAFPAIFLVLVIPINTPLFIVFLGSIFATIVGKMLFGGFGKNIFNPALVGALFIVSSYSTLIANKGGYLTSVDAIAGTTPLSNLGALNYVETYTNIVGKFGDFFNFIFGSIPGTLGEVNKFLIIIAFIFLVYKKVLKYRITIFYVLTVFLMTYIIGFKIGLFYPIFHILSGGLLFGAVFMATDPVTSPTTKYGQILYGISLGILTVLLRFLTPYPEGVLTSILFMNMLVGLFDKISINKNYIYLIILITISMLLSFYISTNLYKVKKEEDIKILNKVQIDESYVYTVSSKGFGLIEAEVKIKDSKIIDIKILNNSSETYWFEIENNDYLNKLIKSNNINDIDTISGATFTSKGLKDMLIKVIEDYEVNYEN